MKNKRGFTLVELLIVLSIFSLLASIIFSAVNNSRIKARDAKRQMDMDTLRKAMEMYYADNESYPSTDGAWISLEAPPQDFTNAIGIYLSAIPQDPAYSGDPTGYTYKYKSDTGTGYELDAKKEGSSVDTWLQTVATGNSITSGEVNTAPEYVNNAPVFIKEIDGVEVYQYTSPQINGIITKPIGNGPFPAVVLNHGGYGSAELFSVGGIISGQYFDNEGNGIIFSKNGYVTIAVDYTHKDLVPSMTIPEIQELKPGASEENINRTLEAIRVLKGLNYVDSNNIIMFGNSMGGFLTLGVVQRVSASDIKAAIIVVAGIKDGNPQNSDDAIVEIISPPENLVNNISCPLLLLNGAEDTKVNVKYPNHLKDLLNTYGKTYTLIIYSDVGHTLLNDKQNEVYNKVFNFLDSLVF